ncbi:MAG: glucose-6-phosphate dehydrogenase assembly protein OpcA [Dehalococcoidia bacterium]
MDIDRIEAELVRLRYDAAGGTGEGDTFAIRTSLLNLVVFATDDRAAREAEQVVAGLPSHHPSRAIVAVSNPSAARSRIDAQLAAHCHISPGLQQQVCCEQITLRVNGRVAHHLHSIIVPLLVSDLPVYVWWTGEIPRNAHILEEMIGSADRFIADSARFAQAEEGLEALAELCQHRPRFGVGDLNWGRLIPWRRLLAQQCDMPDLRRRLEPITAVDICSSRGGRKSPSSQALLLAGWLARQFDWEPPKRPAQRSGDGLTMLSSSGPISVSFGSQKGCPGVRPGWVSTVRLEGGKQGRTVLTIARTENAQHMTLRLDDDGQVEEDRVRVEIGDDGETLAQELDAQRHDAEYEQALRRALLLLGANSQTTRKS